MQEDFVYIMTNKPKGVLYVGVTRNLLKRVYEHKNNLVEGFTKKYNLHNLVYYELTNDIYQAIAREGIFIQSCCRARPDLSLPSFLEVL